MKRGTNTPRIPDISRQILDLWWQNSEPSAPSISIPGPNFQYISHSLTAVGAACASELAAEILRRAQADAERRVIAAAALSQIGAVAGTPEVLARLTDSMRDDPPYVHSYVAMVLGQRNGTLRKRLLARRNDALHRDDESELMNAAESSEQISSARGPEAVLARSEEPIGNDKHERQRAKEMLAQLGSAAPTPNVLARLRDGLCAKHADLRASAAKALKRMGRAAATKEVLITLTDWIRHGHWILRRDAAEVLESFLRTGVRWFPERRGKLRITTVRELSGESESGRW